MTIVTGDTVTVEYTGRRDDGTVFDTTDEAVAEEAGLLAAQPDREFDSLTIEIGADEIVDGFEAALVGLEEGASPTVRLPPEKGYGEWNEDRVRDYERDEFEQMVGGQTPVEGAGLETESGHVAEIIGVDDELVRVDFNHQLADETVEFDIEIVAVN